MTLQEPVVKVRRLTGGRDFLGLRLERQAVVARERGARRGLRERESESSAMDLERERERGGGNV